MSSNYMGIDPARKALGDLVTAAQQGVDTILTRNGRPVARLTAYTPEDTMTTLNLVGPATAVIARARTNSGRTAPEFDYDIATHYDTSLDGIGGIHSPLGAACYEIATEGKTFATADDRDQAADELWEQLRPALMQYARRCRDRKYTGWSAAAKARGQRIGYAD